MGDVHPTTLVELVRLGICSCVGVYRSQVRGFEALGLIEMGSVDASVDFHLPYLGSDFCRSLQRSNDLGFDYSWFAHIVVWLHPETPWPG